MTITCTQDVTDAGVTGTMLAGPLSIHVVFHMPRPKTHFTSRGDLANMIARLKGAVKADPSLIKK